MKRRRPTPLVYGFFGAGQMGEALLAGILRQHLARPGNLRILETSVGRAETIRSTYRVKVEQQASDLLNACDVIVLAVKPQDLEALLSSLPPDGITGRLFVSIAAGKTLGWLDDRLPGARTVRVMPNLAMRVGEGMSVFCLGERATARDRRTVSALLRCSGCVRELPESLFDAVTALSGSGPAFLATLLQAFVDGATALGLPEKEADLLARQTLLGTAKVLAEGQEELPDFVRAVTSAKGTTAAGLSVLETSSMNGIIRRTLAAAARRSRELGRESAAASG